MGPLARRWRGLWARLPELTFRRFAPDSLDAALALLPRPAPSLSLLDIDGFGHRAIEPARLSSFLRTAAALEPAELVVHVNGGILRGPVERPCFDRTASIKLDMYFVGFTLPPAGDFPALESLHLENCRVDLSDLIPRCPRLRKLSIPFWNSDSVTLFTGNPAKTFQQEIYRFQVTDFSILELDLMQRGHVYGAIVLHLLGLCTSIQTLKVTLDDFLMGDVCYANCRCDQPSNWRGQSISLIDLKEVEIQRFRGEDHEVDLLKVLLRCASVLERVTLRFSRKFPPSGSVRMEIDGTLKAYPSVKCTIYP